jgi:4-amino-4-deoxy-L-arabinose transferase-like glycosyltransferase
MRLFSNPLSKEASWLLIFGLFSGAVLAFHARPQWPITLRHQALVLWGGWLMTSIVFFSIAGFFHEYYLSMLGAPLAALVGIGMVELWQIRKRHPWLALGLTLIATGSTLMMQYLTARSFISAISWLPGIVVTFGLGITLLIPWRKEMERAPKIGFALVVVALLLTPGMWSWLTVFHSSGNQSLPSAYDGRSSGPANRGDVQVNQSLLSYLQANTQNMKYLLAVPSSMQGADYVLATGRPVLYLGGFNGQDHVVSLSDLQKMVASHELRFIFYPTRGGGGGPDAMRSDISTWVTSACRQVGFDTAAQNYGAPDGTAVNGSDNRPLGSTGPGMQVSLYDCAK